MRIEVELKKEFGQWVARCGAVKAKAKTKKAAREACEESVRGRLSMRGRHFIIPAVHMARTYIVMDGFDGGTKVLAINLETGMSSGITFLNADFGEAVRQYLEHAKPPKEDYERTVQEEADELTGCVS